MSQTVGRGTERAAYLMLTGMALCFGGHLGRRSRGSRRGATVHDRRHTLRDRVGAALRVGPTGEPTALADSPRRLVAHRRAGRDRHRRIQLALPHRADAGAGVRRRDHRSGTSPCLHRCPRRGDPSRTARPARIGRPRARGRRPLPCGQYPGGGGDEQRMLGDLPGRRRTVGRVLGTRAHREPALQRRQRHALGTALGTLVLIPPALLEMGARRWPLRRSRRGSASRT